MRQCRFCGVDIGSRRSDATSCRSESCKNAQARLSYAVREKDKPCLMCGAIFRGRDKATHCTTCKKIVAKTKKIGVIEQEKRCRDCDVLISKRFVKRTRGVALVNNRSCKACTRKRQRESKLGERNPNWLGKPKKKKLTLAEVATLNSKRMTANNPMRNASTVAKVKKTVKKKIETGDLVYRRGKEHHLWKGNRKVSFVLRSRITAWARAVMERDKFSCQRCGVNSNRLEVHHVKPFRDIVTECVHSLGLGPLNTIDVSSADFDKLSAAVESSHRLEDGVTYCKQCHSEVDSQRKIG